jgi:predicted XRE-type DNA-binding protein
MNDEIQVIDSCGNVFLDLGFFSKEATLLKMRADLMNSLRLFIEENQLTQQQAAERLGISQSRVSDLVRGKWDKFSLDMLIILATRAGKTVRIELEAA